MVALGEAAHPPPRAFSTCGIWRMITKILSNISANPFVIRLGCLGYPYFDEPPWTVGSQSSSLVKKQDIGFGRSSGIGSWAEGMFLELHT